jgi:hypothetical protein
MAGVIGLLGMLTPPRHLIPLLVCQSIRGYRVVWFVFPLGVMKIYNLFVRIATRYRYTSPIHNKNIRTIIFTQALGGLESFITMIGHRFPKFYNTSLYATFLKCNF